jgi:hypothetical protein
MFDDIFGHAGKFDDFYLIPMLLFFFILLFSSCVP